jgi:hypothetical protein
MVSHVHIGTASQRTAAGSIILAMQFIAFRTKLAAATIPIEQVDLSVFTVSVKRGFILYDIACSSKYLSLKH